MVYNTCRTSFIEDKSKPPSKNMKVGNRVKREINKFTIDKNCFICALPANKNRGIVRIINDENNLSKYIELRSKSNDPRDAKVITRLKNRSNESKSMYHEKCRHLFLSTQVKSVSPVTRKDTLKIDKAMDKVYMESSGKFRFNLNEITNIVRDDVSTRTLILRLNKRLGKKLKILQSADRSPILYYEICQTDNICGQWFFNEGKISDFDKNVILKTAAEIISAEVSAAKIIFATTYLIAANFFYNLDENIPALLRNFIENFLTAVKSKTNTKNVIKVDMLVHSHQIDETTTFFSFTFSCGCLHTSKDWQETSC